VLIDIYFHKLRLGGLMRGRIARARKVRFLTPPPTVPWSLTPRGKQTMAATLKETKARVSTVISRQQQQPSPPAQEA
jgi:hypothetical protein